MNFELREQFCEVLVGTQTVLPLCWSGGRHRIGFRVIGSEDKYHRQGTFTFGEDYDNSEVK